VEAGGFPSVASVSFFGPNLSADIAGPHLVDSGTATIRLSYSLAEDARRVRELLDATAERALGDCASLAFFNYDRELYDRLRVIRDELVGAIHTAAKTVRPRSSIN
jgi:hypothetical protein